MVLKFDPGNDQESSADRPEASPPEPVRSRRRMGRLIGRVAVYLVMAGVLLIFGTWWLLSLDAVREKIKTTALDAVNNSIQGRLEVGKISGDLLFGLTIDQVSLTGQDGSIIKVDRLSARYVGPLLLTGIIPIQEVKLEGLDLNLIQAADGTWNVAALAREKTPQTPKSNFFAAHRLLLGQVSVLDSKVTISRPGSGGRETRECNISRLTAGLDLGQTVSLNVGEAALTLDRPQFALTNLKGIITYDPDSGMIDVKQLQVLSKNSNITLKGNLKLRPGDPELDFNAVIKTLSLPELGRVLAVKSLDRGVVSGSIQAKGPLRRLQHQLELKLDGQEVKSQGELVLVGSELLGMNTSLTLRHLNPADIPALAAAKLAGELNADLTIEGTKLFQPGRAGRVTVSLAPSHLNGHGIKTGSIKLAMKDDDLNLEEVRLVSAAGKLDLKGTGAKILTSGSPKNFKFSAAIREFNLNELGLPPRVQGRVNLDLDGEMTTPPALDWANAAAKVMVRLRPSRVLDVDISQGRVDAAWADQRLVLKSLDLDTGLGRLSLKGTAGYQDRSGQAQADITLPDLKKLAALIPQLPAAAGLAGGLSLSGEIKGKLDRPTITLSAKGTSLKYDRMAAQKLNLQGNWQGSFDSLGNMQAVAALDLDGLQVADNQFSRVRLKTNLASNNARFDLALKHARTDELAVAGEVADWSQNMKKVALNNLKITTQGLTLQNKGPVRFTLTPEEVAISSCAMVSNKAHLNAAGRLAFNGNQSLNLSLTGMDVRQLSWLWSPKTPVTGLVSADVNLSGTAHEPILKSRVAIKNGSGYNLSFSDLNATINYAGTRAEVSAALSQQNKKILDLTGRLGANLSLRPWAFSVRGVDQTANLTLHDVDLRQWAGLFPVKAQINGLVSGQVSFSGTARDPVLKGQLTVKNGSGYNLPVSDLETRVSYAGTTAEVSATVTQQGKKMLDLTGQTAVSLSLLPFKFTHGGGHQTVNIAVDDVDMRQWAWLLPSKTPVGGRVTAALTLSGTLHDPIVSGKMAVRHVTGYNLSFSDLEAAVSYAEKKATVTAGLRSKDKSILDLTGRAGMNLSLVPFEFIPGGMDVDLKTRGLKLSDLPIPKKPGVEFDGVLDATAKATGDLTAPQLAGGLTLKNGFLNLRSLGLAYKGLSADLGFSSDKIVVNRVVLQGDKEGILELTGQAKLNGWNLAGLEGKLTGKNFYIPYHKAISARMQPDLTLSGDFAAPKLSGRVTISEGQLNIDRLTDTGPSEIQVVGNQANRNGLITYQESDSTLNWLDPLVANVDVIIPKNAWVKGQGLNSEIAGQVAITKEQGKPFILLGALRTVRGSYVFQGKEFKITEGEVAFIGLPEPIPNLNIQAVTRISNVDIIAKISGTATKMLLSFDSSPQMDRTDIISYLVYGAPAGSLKDQQAFTADKAALSLTGQLAASELKELLAGTFKVDRFSIDAGGGDISKGSVAVGKYVAPDVFVTYRQGFQADQLHQVEVTYEVNRHLSVETQLGNEKTAGVDVLWGYDFDFKSKDKDKDKDKNKDMNKK
ncbi:MAG: translocation/assembly module TamB domain-containing protein [Deltaproteobacteria bacterium]|nr:translocation/assembly module TamB domain-containing protein [Deltaproteobacteria bacterium]